MIYIHNICTKEKGDKKREERFFFQQITKPSVKMPTSHRDLMHIQSKTALASTVLLLVALVHAYVHNENPYGVAVLGVCTLVTTTGLVLAHIESQRYGLQKTASLAFLNMIFILTVTAMALTSFFLLSTVMDTRAFSNGFTIAVALGAMLVSGRAYLTAMSLSQMLALLPETISHKGQYLTSVADRVT